MTYGVITICLNSESTIRRTIESVLSQNLLPDEYVFVDGGSTDQTVDFIKDAIRSAEQTKTGIKFELLNQHTHGGIAAAWNMGLNRLSTDIVFILNSDDWYEVDTAEKIISHFNDNKHIDIILGSARCFNKTNNTPAGAYNPKSFLLLPFLMPVVHPACFVKKVVYQEIGFFDERYKVAADYDFIYRCQRSSVLFRNIDDVVTNMESGGYASKNKAISRKELLDIGLRHENNPILPRVAYLVRVLLNR